MSHIRFPMHATLWGDYVRQPLRAAVDPAGSMQDESLHQKEPVCLKSMFLSWTVSGGCNEEPWAPAGILWCYYVQAIHMSWQQLQSIPFYVQMWSHAPPQHQAPHFVGDIYHYSANICMLAERYRCLKGSVTLTLQASSTKRWYGYEHLAQVHICILILIIWFSSGCYCIPFYKKWL